MRVIEFNSMLGAQYTLTIEDGSQADTSMVAGPQPFVTQTDDDKDPFAPIRSCSGKIQVEGAVSDILDLVQAQPIERKVLLRSHDSQGAPIGVVWQGYLQTRSYSQPLDRAPIYLELPVISPLEVLKSFYPSSAQADLGYKSFGAFIASLNHITGLGSLWINFYFPNLSNPLTTLYYKFSMRNYAEWIEEENRWQTMSYYEILEDICKMFGWQCVEKGYALIFLAFDQSDSYGYKCLSYSEMDSLAAGDTVTGSDYTTSLITEYVWGADHRIDFVDGKNKIVVTGDTNPFDTTIWKFDLDKYSPNNSRNTSHENEYYYTRDYVSNDEISVLTPQNFKYDNFYSQRDSFYGCCLASDRFIVVEANSNAIPSVDTGWMNHFILRTTSSMQSTVIMSITTLNYIFYNKLMSNKMLVLNFHIQRCRSYDGEYSDYTGPVRCRVKIGGTRLHFYDVLELFARNGRLTYRYGWQLTDQGYAFSFPEAISGQVSFELLGFEPLHDDGTYYYSISDISFTYAENWTVKQEWEQKNSNKESVMINGGFEDEYNVDFRLTTYRTGQFGYGIIMGKNHNTDNVPTTLYNSKTPEKALLDRLSSYYSESRRQVVVELEVDGKMLEPMDKHYISGAGSFMCLSQSIDWVNDTCTARLCEI